MMSNMRTMFDLNQIDTALNLNDEKPSNGSRA